MRRGILPPPGQPEQDLLDRLYRESGVEVECIGGIPLLNPPEVLKILDAGARILDEQLDDGLRGALYHAHQNLTWAQRGDRCCRWYANEQNVQNKELLVHLLLRGIPKTKQREIATMILSDLRVLTDYEINIARVSWEAVPKYSQCPNNQILNFV